LNAVPKGVARNRVAAGHGSEKIIGGNQMRRNSPRNLLIAALALALSPAVSYGQPTASADPTTHGATDVPGPVRTGKERLGDKWNDEQRIDNCKVPPDKRGPKPRPAGCAEAVTH
jgi:hypothetical protein